MKRKILYVILLFAWIISCLFIAYIYQGQINNLSSELEASNSELTQIEQQLQEANYQIDDLQTTLEKRVKELERASSVQYDDLTIEEMFRLAASTYDVDYDMLYAIARLETGNFTSNLFVNSNNAGGMRGSDWLSFDSQQEGIMEMARLLRYNYIDQGLTTVEQIAVKYCPPTSSDWASKVRQLMNE